MSDPVPYQDLPVVLDVARTAEVLACGQRKVRELIAAGDLGHVRLGRLIRVPRHCLIEFLEANGGPVEETAAAGDAPHRKEGGRPESS